MESLVQPGRQLEFFETVEELEGFLEVPEQPTTSTGYADIYCGFYTSPQGERVQVAIKQLRIPIPKDRHTEREALKWKADLRLKREVFVWSQTTHPNLHPLLGYRSHPNPLLISPWCRHGNLKDYLRANPDLTRLDKLRLVFQTASGLEHLHSRIPPICHGDIKPEDVLINDDHGAALSNYGLSRLVQDLETPSGLTTSETVKGTVRYMASELFAGQKPNLESDVYAFGGLILTVMSGKPPFDGLLHHVILRRVIQDEPPIPKDHPDLPAHDPLWKLMRRCWNTDPTARPTMRDILLELLGEISREESNSRPRLDLATATEGANENADMDLEIPDALRHEGSLSLRDTNPISAGYSVAGVPVSKVESGPISGELLLATRKILKTVQLNAKVIPLIGKYIRAVAEVGLHIVEIVEATNKSENLSAGLKFNPRRLADILQDLEKQSTQRRASNIFASVAEMQRELEVAQGKIKERYSSNLVQNEVWSSDHASPEWWQGTVLKVLEGIQLLVTLDTTGLVAEFESPETQERNRRLLHRLGDGNYGAHGNAVEDAICLPGTRMEILERIDNWIRDTSTTDRVLWIRGMAGRGKSTIASTVAYNWQFRASCAIFHFRRGHDTLNARIVCALARQLGSSLSPEVRNAVLESVQENEDIAGQRLDVQFETLCAVPLSKLVHQSRTILFIVDALDESQNPKDAVDFVKLIDRHSSSFPINVKFLLTCRPEAPLLRALEPRKWRVEDLESSANVMNDLERFIKRGCIQIRDDYGLPEDWPAASDIKSLVQMSQGLFQWAQTVITYLGNGSPANRLRDLLKRPSTWDGLDDLYQPILSKAFNTVRRDPAKQELLCSILGTLVVAPYPVSLDVIAALYGDNSIFQGVDQVDVIDYLRQDILVDLNSLLLIPSSPTESMHLMHTSIRDLLVDKQRCQEQVYHIDVRQHHERLASLCLDIMLRGLKENICNLRDLSKPNSEVQDAVDKEVSTVIRYCSRAWSIHLTEGTEWSRLSTKDLDGQRAAFERFSQEKLLYWVEVMSLIGGTTEAMVIAKRMCSWLSRSHDRAICDSKLLATLWNDAQRFMIAFSEPISFGALHVYASALAHCPQKTQLWECYGRHAKIRTLRGVQPSTWPANLWTRAGGADVHTIAFSPDGAVLASGSSDHTIRLWDTQTGTPLGQPLTGHDGHVRSVVLSPDGKALASGSDDATIRLWDTQTGSPLGQPLTGHRLSIHSVVFSPDGKVLASGSDDGTIRLWDTRTGTPLGQPLTAHNEWVRSVAFSPDGKVLGSGSSDRTIRLWDAQTGTPLGQPLTGHNDHVWSLAFSPDGRVLASGSDDRTIRLWDAQTGTPLGQPLTGHSHSIHSVVFSPDGKVLASGSSDRTIRFWDTQTGVPLGQPLTGHDDWIVSVAFSPDGRVLASGSSDRTIRLWNAQTGMPLGLPPRGHVHLVRSAVSSLNDRVLASGSDNGTIQLWETQAPTPLGEEPTDHHDSVSSVAFSPDGKVLASGSWDGTIRLWEAQTGEPLGKELTDHHASVSSVAFSPDGRVLASGSSDGAIRFWDTQTATPLGQLKGHTEFVCSVAFSPDGNTLASGSDDSTIRLWNAQTGAPLGEPLTDHKDAVRSVAFSPDGKILASGSDDSMIQLWDTQTGTTLAQPLTGHAGPVRSIVFSQNSEVLASGSSDGTIRLWDTRTRTALGLPATGGNSMVSFVPILRLDPLGHPGPEYCIPNIQDHWLKLSASRFFWLPSQYWADSIPRILLSNGILVIQSDGNLSIFDVSDLALTEHSLFLPSHPVPTGTSMSAEGNQDHVGPASVGRCGDPTDTNMGDSDTDFVEQSQFLMAIDPAGGDHSVWGDGDAEEPVKFKEVREIPTMSTQAIQNQPYSGQHLERWGAIGPISHNTQDSADPSSHATSQRTDQDKTSSHMASASDTTFKSDRKDRIFSEELVASSFALAPAVGEVTDLLQALGRVSPQAVRNKHKIYSILRVAHGACKYIVETGNSPGGQKGTKVRDLLERMEKYSVALDALEEILLEFAEVLPLEVTEFGPELFSSWLQSRSIFTGILNKLCQPPFSGVSYKAEDIAEDSFFDDCSWLSRLLFSGVDAEVAVQLADVPSTHPILSVTNGLHYLESQIKRGVQNEPTRDLVIDIATLLARTLAGTSLGRELHPGESSLATESHRDRLIRTLADLFSVIDMDATLGTSTIQELAAKWIDVKAGFTLRDIR